MEQHFEFVGNFLAIFPVCSEIVSVFQYLDDIKEKFMYVEDLQEVECDTRDSVSPYQE